MRIITHDERTYLYLNGISVESELSLHEGVVLIPVTKAFHYQKVSDLLKNDLDYAVAAVSGRSLGAQMRIDAPDAEQLAVKAWNASWDCLLLGALFHSDVMGNIQCNEPVENLEHACCVNITNYHFRAAFSEPYRLSKNDVEWVNANYAKAHMLLDNDSYMTAIHAMASYQWHSMPRVQLAILWSGIEALFEASTEISFRISVYIANFLSCGNTDAAKNIFEQVRRLYGSRSKAVHGSKIKGDIASLVSESAALLNQIIRRCAEIGSLPDINELVFPVPSESD